MTQPTKINQTPADLMKAEVDKVKSQFKPAAKTEVKVELKDGCYIPPESIQSELPHEIIAIIGAPGAGKTTSCIESPYGTGFPNRIWLDWDHKLPVGEVSIPFWSPEFCDKQAKRTASNVPNQRDAFSFWLRNNHDKFTDKQTVILDSASKMLNALDMQCNLERDAQGDSKKANWDFWAHKLRFWQETMTHVKNMKARFVMLFHETQERNDEGNLTGKIKPILDGSYKDQILGDFTDVWRQLCNPWKLRANGMVEIENGKKVCEPGWFWQLLSDEIVNTNTNPVLGRIIREKGIARVKANYSEIQKLYNT